MGKRASSSVNIPVNARLALTPGDLQQVLPIGRAAAYKLARKIGVRIGKTLVVSRVRLDEWLAGGGDGGGDK